MAIPVDQALAKHRPSRRIPSTIGVDHGANRSKTAKNVPKEKSAVRLQYGALPYRITKAEPLEILLVTVLVQTAEVGHIRRELAF